MENLKEKMVECTNKLNDMFNSYQGKFFTDENKLEIENISNEICESYLVDYNNLYEIKNTCELNKLTTEIINLKNGEKFVNKIIIKVQL